MQQLEARLADGARTISQQADTLRRQEQQLAMQTSRNGKNSVSSSVDDMEGWRQMERKEDVANVLAVVADDESLFDAPSGMMGGGRMGMSRSDTNSPTVQQYEQMGEERGVEGVIAALCMHILDPHSQEAGMKVLQHLANNGG